MNKQIELFGNFKYLNTKEEDNDDIIIEGFANKANIDRVGDVIVQEAYEKGGLDNYKKNPIILYQHNYNEPIGKAVELSYSSEGLKIKAKIPRVAGKPYELIKSGILQAFSIGFSVLDAKYDQATDVLKITDLELFEVSVVSVPAQQDSLFSVAKQLEDLKQEYKQEFASSLDANTDVEDIAKAVEPTETTSVEDADKKETNMNEAELKALQDKMKAMESELKATKDNLNAAEDMLDDVAVKEAKAKEDQAKVTAKIEVKSQVEDLIKEVEKRFLEKEDAMSTALKGLETELKDKADEMTAITNNKMNFRDNDGTREAFTRKQKDEAVLVAKLLGQDVKNTKFFKDIVQKSGLEHTPAAQWEQEFNTNIFNDMKDKLVLEPLFQTLSMNTPSMQIPINPEAGDAQWISSAADPYLNQRSTDGSSTGTAVDHKLGETTITAYKLASKEYIGYEEEEDTILAIVPIIRDAITRRMARTSDASLLRGTGAGTGGDAVSPFKGLLTLAADGSNNAVQVAVAAKWTVDDLQAVRRQLGARGLNPGEVKYLVSEEAYYDLLEDPDFRTMDLVGDRATVIKGQIGSVNGSPVVVSDSFEAKAATKPAVAAVYTGNFFVGNLRTMMVERDTDIINQKRVIIATRRMGFIPMITDGSGFAEGIATGVWIA